MEAVPTVEALSLPDEQVRPAAIRRFGYDSSLRRLLAFGDGVAILTALAAALFFPVARGTHHSVVWGVFALPLMLLLFKLYGLYDRDVKRISYSTVDDLPHVFHAVVIGTLVLWAYSRYSALNRLDLVELVQFSLASIALVLAARFFIRTTAVRVIGRERALLIGDDAMAQALVGKLASHPEYRLDVLGALSSDQSSGGSGGLAVLGDLEDLEHIAASRHIGRVILAARDVNDSELEQTLRRCRSLSLKVSVLPGLADVLGPGVEIDDVEGVAVLGVNPPWLPRSSRALKRAMDLAVAIPCLLVLSPLLLVVALAVKLNSPGPALFAQERVGRGGKRFRVLKFRTMVVDAEARRAELFAQSEDPNWLKLEKDPRITRIGHWLRLSSLDEVPQLWNVLRGEMSLVGPRPLIPIEDERVTGWARGRLDLTPGITGYWQVLGRTRIPFEEMVKLDYLYVMNWSLWEDVRLMLRTLPVVLKGKGAN